jgi:hypothetical protein
MLAAPQPTTPQASMCCGVIKILSRWNQMNFSHDWRGAAVSRNGSDPGSAAPAPMIERLPHSCSFALAPARRE